METAPSITAIQTQREIWLRAREALIEREREQADALRRAEEAVTRAAARLEEEWNALQAMVVQAAAQLDGFLRPPEPQTKPVEDEKPLAEFESAHEGESPDGFLMPTAPSPIVDGMIVDGAAA